MRRGMLVLLMSCHAAAPRDPAATLPQLEAARLAALGRADAATLEPMLDADFVLTLDSLERTKPQLLARMRELAANRVVRDETADAVAVRWFGTIAVTRGRAITVEPDGRRTVSRFTNVWRWTGGRWQLAVGHVGASEPIAPAH